MTNKLPFILFLSLHLKPNYLLIILFYFNSIYYLYYKNLHIPKNNNKKITEYI